MTTAATAAVVVDTMVISWLLEERRPFSDQYRHLIGASRVLLAFQTVMELRYGALRAQWGELRRRRLDRQLAGFSVIQPDDSMITICAELRHACRQLGLPLASKVHDGDRWIAAAAVRLGLPLVSHDGVFARVPRLDLITAEPIA